MLKVQFAGRVLPALFNVSVPLTPKIHWKETELEMTFHVHITDGNVIVDCETNKFIEKDHFIQLYRRAFDLARATTDLFAFSTGAGVTVFLEKFTYPDGTTKDILPGDPSLWPAPGLVDTRLS